MSSSLVTRVAVSRAGCQPVAVLLATLGVLPSHSQPHASDDNPLSEAQLEALMHRPRVPGPFGRLEDAEAFFHRFFPWTP